jgi:hypothetical protein
MDYRYIQYAFHGDIFTTISDDGGLTWPFETRGTTGPTGWYPSIDFLQDTLVVVWPDMRYDIVNVSHEIVFNRSNDGGRSWLREYRLTETIEESGAPNVSFDSGRVSVVWVEDVSGEGNEIFYKKYTPDTLVSIDEQEVLPLSEISLSAYPNPFNGNLRVEVSAAERGKILIYDIQGKLINEFDYSDGETTITWDGQDRDGRPITSGTYFLEAKGGDTSKRIRVVYVK